MAYKWDKDGNLVGDGLPQGAKLDIAAYQAAVKEYEAQGPMRNIQSFYPSMAKPKLADAVTGFKYDKAKNQVMAFVPLSEQRSGQQNTIAQRAGLQQLATLWDKSYGGSIADVIKKPKGSWIPVSGIDLDPSTLSGTAEERISFREDGGATLAAFGAPNQEVGYMRLRAIPQQAAKLADNINLRSNTQRAGPVATKKARI